MASEGSAREHEDSSAGREDPETAFGEFAEQTKLTPLWAVKAVQFITIGSAACLFKFITVFFQHIGLTSTQIGFIQMCAPWMNFTGQLVWASASDRLKSYKEVLAVTTGLGACIVCCSLLPLVQQTFALLCVVILAAWFFLSSTGSLTDFMSLQIVQDYEDAGKLAASRGEAGAIRSLPTYGETRLWGAAGWGLGSLFVGSAMDMFGVPVMFVAFATLLVSADFVIIMFFPNQGKSRPREEGSEPPAIFSFEVLWFFLNLVFYGFFMALVETFLFVYLKSDFEGTNNALLGSSVTVMCVFELPVFLGFKHLLARMSLTTMLTICHYVFAVRAMAYCMLPASCPYLVLLVEPLHGITFALMWSCSVEYAKRLAPPGAEAKMQAILNGLYFQISLGIGSQVWGRLAEPPPLGVGFRWCYFAAGPLIVLWSLVWNLGWCLHKRRHSVAPLATEALTQGS